MPQTLPPIDVLALFPVLDQKLLALLRSLKPETAWQLFTKGIAPATAEAASELHGDPELARAALRMVGVMA